MQVSDPGKIGPRLNEAGEMLMVFPPTSKEIGVLKLQGTEIEDKNIFKFSAKWRRWTTHLYKCHDQHVAPTWHQ